ncbi:hypothetical protein A3649_24630, partial (plasmid) [Mycobacterium ulcerans]
MSSNGSNGAAARRRQSSIAVEDVPDPQVPKRAQRRTFTAKYKLAILEEYERAERAQRGALLRRENLYSSLRDCRGKGVSGLIGPGVSGPERSHDDQDCRGCAAITKPR